MVSADARGRVGREDSGRRMPAEAVTALDATFLELEEADESAHMHIGAVVLFEPPEDGSAPSLAQLRARLDRVSERLPRFRQRLSEPRTGGLQWPRWVDQEGFEIAHHVREAGLPAPAGEDELREWAQEYFSTRLDRTGPLWEIVLLRLGDGRWAMVSKTHHCMVDGVGSVDFGQQILETEPVAADDPHPPADREPEPPPARAPVSALRQVAEVPLAVGSAAAGAARFGLGVARGIVAMAGAGVDAAAHPDHAREHWRRAKALVGVLIEDELSGAPATSLNEPIGGARSLGVVEVPLDELKRIKASLGGTVNDVVLAAMAGSLRRLLVARGEAPPSAGLRAMVPVNIRTAAEQLELGNRITSLFVGLPVAEPDPLHRYRLQIEEAERLKAGDQAIGSRGIIDLAAHAPPVLHTFLARTLFATRLFNLTITNVPGPQLPLYAFGSRVTAVWPLVPLAARHALGVAVFSYDGRVFFCFNAARDAVPDLEVALAGLREEIATLSEIAAASGNGAR